MDRHLAAGRIEEAIEQMSRHERDAFPPIYTPRPRQWAGMEHPPLEQVIRTLGRVESARWVQEIFLIKTLYHWRSHHGGSEHLDLLASVLPKLEAGPAFAAKQLKHYRNRLKRADPDEDHATVQHLRTLIDLGERHRAASRRSAAEVE